jgi:citronellol/citronellal dehydrogenase
MITVITGASSGIGEATARLLAREHRASVVLVARREDRLRALADELGPAASYVAADLLEDDAPARIRAHVGERHAGRLDVLVNNAGGQYFVPAEDITAKGWAAVQRLNVGGTAAMTEAAAAEDGFGPEGGVVVNVTVSPHHGMPAMAHTGAARAAVEALTRELATRWADRGIALVAAAIGRFDTESLRKYPEVVWRSAAASIPLQRLGTMDEFGELVAMLASPLGRALSGSVVTLDGGADNWWGAWPPPAITVDDEGTVPTEERGPPRSG